MMFAVGGIPALFVFLLQRAVKEPERWKPAKSAARAIGLLFSREYRRRTILNSIYLLVSITGLWASTVYVPSATTYLALKAGETTSQAGRMASAATIVVAVGTILGCIALPPLAERFGRLKTLGLYFAVMSLTISTGFGWAFYRASDALPWFLTILFFQGVAGANFTMYSLWLPEQYRTECRASAFGFATSAGRFIGAGITFLVGAGVSSTGTIGTPVALTSLAFLAGLLLLPFGIETKGHILPE
jgi:MFS family permease